MIPRFKTLDAARPGALGGHLRHGFGGFVIEQFLWGPLVGLDRQDLLGSDERMREHALRSRLGNCDQLFRVLGEGLGCKLVPSSCVVRNTPAHSDARRPAPAWPYDTAEPSTVGLATTLSVACRIFLDGCDYWSGAPTIGGVTVAVPPGALLVTHGFLPVGCTANHRPESSVSVDILLTPPWLVPPK